MIAVLSSNFITTSEWLNKNKGPGIFFKTSGIFKTNTGIEYLIIMDSQGLYGWHFDSYVKSPDYETLEDLVKTRIR